MNKEYQEALERIIESFGCDPAYYGLNVEFEILQELVDKANKYDELQKIFDDKHICEIKSKFNKIECNANKCDTCPLAIGDDMCLKITFEDKWHLHKERDELKQKLQRLIDKETPKKVNKEIIGYASLAGMPEIEIYKTTCPICDKELCYEKYNYCPDCGQALDWSDE